MRDFSRKAYIDNLRSITILMLFPFHVFMIYNNWGETFYLHGKELLLPSLINSLCYCWMMPLLFALAGISSFYALEKRSFREFAKERLKKLLVPLVAGLILIVPVQPYIASLYWYGKAGYFDSFTKITDISGYDGAFAIGHLWFVTYLLVLTFVCLPLMMLHKKIKREKTKTKSLLLLIGLGIIPLFSQLLLNIEGKSFGEFIAYFLLAYFVLSDELVLAKLKKHRYLLSVLSILGLIEVVATNHQFQEFVSWLCILSILGLGKAHLNFENKISIYLRNASFGIYLFHQSWIVIFAYFILPQVNSVILQIILILVSSIIATFITYELAKRIRLCRWLFAIRR